jgi:hypothetical protein
MKGIPQPLAAGFWGQPKPCGCPLCLPTLGDNNETLELERYKGFQRIIITEMRLKSSCHMRTSPRRRKFLISLMRET